MNLENQGPNQKINQTSTGANLGLKISNLLCVNLVFN